LPKIIELNDEEMDWLDEGHGFCALADLPKEDYDRISYNITLKLREAYNQAELKNENRYLISLTQEEIEYIHDIIIDLFIGVTFQSLINDIKNVLPEFREEMINSFLESLELTNNILGKMEIPLQILKDLENHLNELQSTEEKIEIVKNYLKKINSIEEKDLFFNFLDE